ncbi:MAG TPA: NTP transferase domain-containing protein, partial [Propionibacteriaceae bacterium]|nr:NTP transferase domain-containing protein [Propionibacteriaceae bacterium]
MTDSFDAIILAGGQGLRLGGVSKADVIVSGERLLGRVLRSTAGAACT